MKHPREFVFLSIAVWIICSAVGTVGAVDWSQMISEDGSFAPETIYFEQPVSWSGLPMELARRGIQHHPVPHAGRAPQVDEYGCGVPPEADNPVRAMITPDGAYAVTAFYLTDNIGIQNLSTYSWEQLIDVGTTPVDVDITPSGSHALITCLGDNTVVAVNLSTYAVDYTVPVGNSPVASAIAPDGSRAIVLNSDDSSATIIELSGWTVEQTVSSPAIDSGVTGFMFSSLGSFLYTFSRVIVLDDSMTAVVPAWDVVNFINLGSGSVDQVTLPSGLAFHPAVSPDGTTLAVGGSGSGTDNDINFFDLTQTPPVHSGGFELTGWNYNTKGITFNADGSLIAAAHFPSSGGYTYVGFYDTTTYAQVYIGLAGAFLQKPTVLRVARISELKFTQARQEE